MIPGAHRVCRCGNVGVLYPGGIYCGECLPFAPPPVPDPALTLEGLRQAAGIPTGVHAPGGPTVVDDRAIASGKRRSNAGDWQDARAREAARRP